MSHGTTYEAQYQKGFNEGYLIAKHLPDLSNKLATIANDTPRIEGFKDGRKQYIIEHDREHRPAWMKNERRKQEDKPKDKDKDMER